MKMKMSTDEKRANYKYEATSQYMNTFVLE